MRVSVCDTVTLLDCFIKITVCEPTKFNLIINVYLNKIKLVRYIREHMFYPTDKSLGVRLIQCETSKIFLFHTNFSCQAVQNLTCIHKTEQKDSFFKILCICLEALQYILNMTNLL